MEPEISRRCLACGASVRGTAFFCPECGKPIKAGAATADSAGIAPEKPAPRKIARRSSSSAPAVGPAGRGVEERPPRNRMRTAAREAVEGKIGPRVEKLRQASNVMLEEVSDDPNLRFVIIAIAIFVIALLFLWFNYILG